MADIVLNLSGQGGLGSGFAGNLDEVTVRPERMVGLQDGQMADGYFNPYLREGYLCPTTTTTTTITTDTTPDSEFTSVEYDPVAGRVYWGDDTRNIYLGSDLEDASLVDTLRLANDSVYADRVYDNLYDLQMYSINDEDRLFFVGKGRPFGGRKSLPIASQPSSEAYVTAGLAIMPSGSTQPSVLGTARGFNDSIATLQVPYSLTGGTDTVLWALVFTDTQTVNNVYHSDNSGTPSIAMTFGGAFNMSGRRAYVYYLVNPDESGMTTPEVWVAGTSGSANLLCYVFETDNTDQTSPLQDDYYYGASGQTVLADIPFIDENQLTIVGGMFESDSEPTINDSVLDTEYYSSTSSAHSDILFSADNTEIFPESLIVGHTLPDLSSPSLTWSTTDATGAFVQELPQDYAFMRTADNGFAYVFAGNQVHRVDGTTFGGTGGSITKNVLLFPNSFEITDAVDYRSQMYIGIHKYGVNNRASTDRNFVGSCGIYVWDRISVQFSNSDFIELPGIKEIRKIYVSPDQVLKLIVVGDHGMTELREFGYNDSGGVVYRAQARLGVGAYPQVPDGLTSAGDKVVWLGNDGTLYAEKTNSITKISQIKAPATTESGQKTNIRGGAVLYGALPETAGTGFRTTKQAITLSYLDSTAKTERVYPFNLTDGSDGAQTPNAGNVYTGVTYIPVTSVVRRIRIYNAPVATASDTVIATVKVYFNQSTSPALPTGMTKTITAKEAKRGYVDLNISKQYVHAVQLEFEWATGVNIGDEMYMPSAAIITTEDTSVATPDSE